MKIYEVEQITGLTQKTIRFYEGKGLLQVSRSENGYRNYSDDDVATLKLIKQLRSAGITVTDIKLYMFGVVTMDELLEKRKAEILKESGKNSDQYQLCEKIIEKASVNDWSSKERFAENVKIESANYGTLSVGIDIGTTTISAVVFDIDHKKQVEVFTLPHNAHIASGVYSEQSVSIIMEKAEKLLTHILNSYSGIVSIGVSGQMHGIVYLDRNANPVSQLITWQDGRGDLEYKDGKAYVEYMREMTGSTLATGYGAVTVFYDTVNNLIPENAASFCTIHDLLVMKLVGRKQPLVHISDAASFGLFDLATNAFCKEQIEKLGMKYTLFPSVCRGYQVLGHFHGIPVSAAIGDNQASFLGSVSDWDRSILINMGTGGQISSFVSHVVKAESLECRPLVDDGFILAGATLCGGRAYALLEKLLREIAETVTGVPVKSAYPAMDKLMNSAVSMENPLIVDTTFSGTRTQPSKRGSIQNISTENFNMKSICCGFLWGMTTELYDLFREMKKSLPEDKQRLVGSGNGIRNNPALKCVIEQMFGLPMLIPVQEEAAFGALLYSLVAAGVYKDANEVAALIKYHDSIL